MAATDKATTIDPSDTDPSDAANVKKTLEDVNASSASEKTATVPDLSTDDIKELWLADSSHESVLLAIIQRVDKLMPSAKNTRSYMEAVRVGLPSTTLKLSQGVSTETNELWLKHFSPPITDSPVPSDDYLKLRSSLFEVWMHVVDRMLQAWVTNQHIKSSSDMYRKMLSELLWHVMQFLRASEPDTQLSGSDDAAHNKELRLARAHYNKLLESYTRRRDGVYSMMKQIESTSPEHRQKLFSTQRIWNTLDYEDNADLTHCTTSIADMARCRASELTRLRLFRHRMEDALSFNETDPQSGTTRTRRFQLHRVHKHLFDLRTYRALRFDVMEFIRASSDNKVLRMKLLQKYFEREALVEVHRRMLEMIEDVEAIKAHIGMTNPPQNLEDNSMLKRIGNLEWACTRTWQEVFNNVDTGKAFSDTNSVKPSLGPSDKGPITIDDVPSTDMKGGGPLQSAGIAVVDTADSSPSILVAQVHQDIIAWQNLVRKVLDVLRGGIMEIVTLGAPHMGGVGVYIHDAIVPRLRNVLKALDENVVRNYMSQVIAPEDDMQLSHEERSRKIQLMNKATISSTDIVSYKFSDTSVSLMYVLKGLRLLLQVVALFAAQKIFTEAYVSATSAGDRSSPPKMTSMLYTFLAIDATFQLFVLLILVLLSYLYKRPDNTYIIDDDFIMTFLVEYFVTTVSVAVLGAVFARLMRGKRYFEYATQGIGVIQAYRDVMIGTCAIVSFMPFFLLF